VAIPTDIVGAPPHRRQSLRSRTSALNCGVYRIRGMPAFVNFTGGTLLNLIAHICIIASFIAVIALFTAHALSAVLEA
jgi:hypothetical protein